MAIAAAILAFVSVSLGIVFSIMIVQEVSKRGVKINFVLIRLYIIKNPLRHAPAFCPYSDGISATYDCTPCLIPAHSGGTILNTN